VEDVLSSFCKSLFASELLFLCRFPIKNSGYFRIGSHRSQFLLKKNVCMFCISRYKIFIAYNIQLKIY